MLRLNERIIHIQSAQRLFQPVNHQVLSVLFVLKFLYTIFPIKIPKIQVLELTDLEYEILRINVLDKVFSHAQNKIKIRSTDWKTYFEKYQIKS